ncbi:hypothetical protein [Ruegeria arenilitoris]|uniref:hypothetical protein n=1 Tax=Ruegeria arenilitoris TaxID=1173585 RepID=UPI00147A67D2|nr:hypothetical protein [Ruegeria arenilitoris]
MNRMLAFAIALILTAASAQAEILICVYDERPAEPDRRTFIFTDDAATQIIETPERTITRHFDMCGHEKYSCKKEGAPNIIRAVSLKLEDNLVVGFTTVFGSGTLQIYTYKVTCTSP